MKQKLLSIAIVLLTIASFSSCRCGGCDEIETTIGASLGKYGTISLVSNESFPLVISPETENSEGRRRCFYKDLIICQKDGLDAEKMKLICDTDLLLETGSITAGTNLLAIEVIRDTTTHNSYYQGQIALLLKPKESFPGGRYFFTLEGTTAEGKTLSDTNSFLFTR